MSQQPARRVFEVRATLSAAAILAAVLAAWFFRGGEAPPELPDPALDGVEDEVRDAIKAARLLAARSPRSSDAWGLYGKVLHAHGRGDEAILCYRVARRLSSADPQWPYLEALCQRGVDNPEAIRLTRMALDLFEPDTPERCAAQISLVRLLLDQGEPEEVARLLGEMRPGPGQEAAAPYYRGLLAMQRGDWAEAARLLEPLQDHPACRARVAKQLAQAHGRLGDEAKAARHAARASALGDDGDWHDPLAAEAAGFGVGLQNRLQAVQAREQAGRFQEALNMLCDLEQRGHAGALRVQFGKGRILRHLGRLPEAEAALRKAVEIAPADFGSRLFLGMVLLARGEIASGQGRAGPARAHLEEAEAVSLAALKIDPLDAWAASQVGQARLLLGRTAEALPQLRQAAARRPEAAVLHMLLGEALARLGHRGEAEAEFALAAKTSPPGDQRPAELLDAWKARWEAKKP